MAVSGKVADGFVKIALQGLNEAKAQLLNLSASAAKGFAVATASITGLVRSADPVRWTIFTQKLEILSFHIGRTFIPLLQMAITWVDKLIAVFANLTDHQRDGILKWTKIGLVITGFLSAVGTVIGFVGKLVGVFQTLYGVIMPVVRVIGQIVPIGRLLKIITGLFLLFHEQGGKAGEVFGKLGKMVTPVFEQIKKVVLQVWDIFQRFAGMVGGVVDNIFSAIGGGLLDAIEAAMPLIERGLNTVKDILELISKALESVMGVVKDAQSIYSVLKEKKVSELPKAVAQGVGRSLTNEGADLAKSLNPFGSWVDKQIDGVRDFVKDDVIGGKEDETKMLAAREELDNPRGSVTGPQDYGGDDDKDPNRFRPLPELQKVQSMGVEEAFKKNQAAAGFDPTKIAANERRRWQADNMKLLEAIAAGVAPGALTPASETY